MRTATVFVFGLVLALGTATGLRAEDKIIGAVWELWAKGQDGKYKKHGEFRATLDGKVYHDGKVVGTHKSSGNDIEVTITDGKNEDKNGSFKGTKAAKAGTHWEGTFTNKKGTETPVRLRLVKD